MSFVIEIEIKIDTHCTSITSGPSWDDDIGVNIHDDVKKRNTVLISMERYFGA